MLENQSDGMVDESSRFDEVSSVIIEESVNKMYLPNKVQKIKHEPFQNNMHVEGEIIDVDEGVVVKECNDKSIVFRSLKSCQRNVTMKSRQRHCNAINFKKPNTLLQAKKSLFKVKKVSIIGTIRFTGKRKSEHWL